MLLLKTKLKEEAKFLPNGIIGMNSFLNHQVDAALLKGIGEEFANRFNKFNPTKILTAETSGVLPALATAMVLNVPMLYARKERPLTMVQEPYVVDAESHTKTGKIQLFVAREFLLSADRVLIIDDVLATAVTILALVGIVNQSGASLVGIGSVIEKCYQNGRSKLGHLAVPIESLAKIASMSDSGILFAEE